MSIEIQSGEPHNHQDHSHETLSENISYVPTDFVWPEFAFGNRYNPEAPYNEASQFQWSKNIGLPLPKNFSYPNVLKEGNGNPANGKPLSVYAGLEDKNRPGSNQWDSFPAGEAQQFLITSVDQNRLKTIGSKTQDGKDVNLDVITTSTQDRPYTMALTVTPYNAGPIPHTHWAEDEWFILLQGEMDGWLPVANKTPYKVGEIPGQNGVPKINEYYYVHMTPGQVGYLPAGFTHNYRNTSPTGEPLIFLTIWSRNIDQNQQFRGGIEEFFVKPGIGIFADTANEAAGLGSMYNKDPGSPEGKALQDRFTRYFYDFPNYYVSMSQNFGSYLADGGNWNPAIPKDTQPIPVPPPTNPYLPPGPNNPSQSVNFNIPLDPSVIKKTSIPIGTTNTQQIFNWVNNYESQTQKQQGNLYTEFYQDPSNPQNYLLIEQWKNYSQLDQYQNSSAYQGFLSQLNSLVVTPVSSSIGTIDTNSYADDQKVLIGKFKAQEGKREQIKALANQLIQRTKTNEVGKNLAFEFYEDPQHPNQYLFYEKYINGQALTEHLGAQYTNDFFASFAPLLTGNGLADADVNIYSIHGSDSPLSNVYMGQKQGNEILQNLFQTTPELSVSLTNHQGTLLVNNQNQTPGIGINLLFKAAKSGDQPVEYGLFQVDDANNSVKGLSPGQPGYLEAVRERAVILFNTNVNQGLTLGKPSRNIPVETTHRYAIYQVKGGSIKDVNPNTTFSFQDPQFVMQTKETGFSFRFGNGWGGSVALNGPVQNFQDTLSQPQREGFNIFDTSTITDRQIASSFQVINNSRIPHKIGFYPVENKQGAVLDPVTNTLVKPGDPNYAKVAVSQSNNLQFETSQLAAGTVTNLDNFVINSGKLYAPFVTTVNDPSATYFAYKEANPDRSTHIISMGTNSFAIEDGKGGIADFNDVVFKLNFTFAKPPYPIV